jgi:pyochelin synthetase
MTSIAELVAELWNDGISLWEDGAQLRFRAPKGAITDRRRQQLRDGKEAILTYLRAGDPVLLADPAGRFEPFPLTDVQAAYALGRRAAFDYSGSCQLYLEVALPLLAGSHFEDAWNALVRRHDMLRAVVHADGYQRVLEEVPRYRIAVADLRGATAEAVERSVTATRGEMDHRSYAGDAWPLFELRVTQTAAHSVLHVSFDFLIADYVSILVLLGELRELAFEPLRELAPLAVTFRDCVLAQRAARAGSRYERDRAYWWPRIDTLPPAPELPLSPPAAGTPRNRFRRRQTALTALEWATLKQHAARASVTPSAAVLAAYAAVLARWSRRPSFSLNLTVVDRPRLHPQIDSLVGDFTSVTLLAVDDSLPQTFSERAGALQAQLWESMDHRLVSGVEVLREIAERRGRGAALMPIVFTSALSQGPAGALAERGEFRYGSSQTPQVWIDCQIVEVGGALALIWDVREGVFLDGVADAMFASMSSLLSRLAGEAAAWDDRSPVPLPPDQSARRLTAGASAAPLPGGLLHDAVVAQARATPDRPAVVTPSRSLTYAQLLGRANAVAFALAADGLEPGEIVGVLMDKGWEQIVAVLAVLLAGGAYLPVDTNQPPLRRAQILEDAGVRRVLTQSWLWAGGELGERFTLAVDAQPAEAAEAPPVATKPGDLAYVIYTSGSTGKPKGVAVAHRSALNTVADVTRRFGIGCGDRVLGVANLGFDLSVYDVFGLLAVGGAVVLPDPARGADPSHWAELIAAHGVTLWNSVPAQLQMLVDYLDVERGLALPSLRVAFLSGDWIAVTLPDAARARLPDLALVGMGGATEASIWSIFHRIGEVPPEWRSIPYGRPLANQRIDVLDEKLRPSPEWVTGELYIAGAGLAEGYLGDDLRTAERFIKHPLSGERLYRTGDFGRFLPQGEIEFLGRQDRQVKLRGHRIELAEVEAALLAHPSVGAASVLLDTAHGGEPRIAAFVEAAPRGERQQPGSDGADLAGLAAAAADAATGGAPVAPFLAFAALLDRAALCSILAALRGAALFATARDAHTLGDIMVAARVGPRRRRLVRRWLAGLVRAGMLERDARGGTYRQLAALGDGAAAVAWDAVDRARAGADYPAELVDYLRTSAQHLPQLARDEEDPLQLLFPGGELGISEAVYRDNLTSRYTNQAVVEIVRRLAVGHAGPGPLRVLEVGAGVGGTSAELIPALAGVRVEYTFSDLSPFFLTAARERFRGHAFVDYALLDLNRDYRAQGFAPNSFDVVVAGDVLHATRDVAAACERLCELLVPGGSLVLVEMTRDHASFVASLEFLLVLGDDDDFDDLRRGSDQTFLTRAQWQTVLANAGAELVLCLPEPDHPLAEIGMHVFAARVKTDRVRIDPARLLADLEERLPRYMVPAYAEVVDRLPLTSNGKVDQRALRAWLPPRAPDEQRAPVGDDSYSELERRVAAIWAEQLGGRMPGRTESLFALGGDSLVISRLAGRMREQLPEGSAVPFDRLLRQMLQEPTVAAVAALLLAGGSTLQVAPAAEAACLVSFAAERTGAPLVLVHDTAQSAASYSTAGADGPVLGVLLASPRFAEATSAQFVDRVADAVVAELIVHPSERFSLHGAGFGGIFALEIARRLAEAGRVVERLVLAGGERLAYHIADELLVELAFARSLGLDPARLGFPAAAAVAMAVEAVLARSPGVVPSGALAGLAEPALAPVALAFARLGQRAPAKRLDVLARVLSAANEVEADADALGARLVAFGRLLSAVAAHRAAPYAGDAVVVRAGDDPLFGGPGALAFWESRCLGEVSVRPAAVRAERAPS